MLQNLTDKFDVFTELQQNNGTAGGIYEGLYQPHRDGIWCWVCQWYQLLELCPVKNETNSQQSRYSHPQYGLYIY